MLRFLALAVPALLLLLAFATFAATQLGLEPDHSALARLGVARNVALPRAVMVAALAFESLALLAFYSVVAGRTGAWWLDGLATGLLAWLFRGPLVVVTIATWTRLPTEIFWSQAKLWLVVYPLAGLLAAALGRRTGWTPR
ncbi:MAG: hypothetical protein U0X73_11380 [Thermoanaerobaculia bacterium]